ncbi:hypothetical protein HRI_002577700 [Hibiscus trionum]|uniref:Uncharacterized protein n=1 Tax=Hibiscus trionum TaxID=183268 RepID=A0A9W7I2E7_HIBTR|nr:hypothetical protein HRI_002577700 [Hibiscus trionum]
MEMADDSFYMSAPTSPRRSSPEVGGLCFFSVPTSPTKTTLKSAYQDWTSNGDEFEFEFETSRRFIVGEREAAESQPEESLPAMAFADELFHDGKVMPLKPPPGLQHHHKQSSILSSPRSSSGGLRLSFQRRSLWNDDFDPFMAALKNVKEEKAKNHRRARSLSPSGIQIAVRYRNDSLVSNQHGINQRGLILPNPNSNKTMESKEEVKKRQAKVAEPKGVVLARRARLVKLGNEENPRKPGVDSTMKQAKGQKMKKLWFRGESMGTEAMAKIKRKCSLKAMGITQYKEEKTLTSLIQYRPKLLLCMGFGAKYMK